jgi:hypothetical protein
MKPNEQNFKVYNHCWEHDYHAIGGYLYFHKYRDEFCSRMVLRELA